MADDTLDPLDSVDGQTILEHLNELRKRVTWGMAGVLLGTFVSALFAERIINELIGPFCNYVSDGQCTTLGPTESIEIYFRISLITGAAITMPWLMVQVWLFIAPGLHKHERRYVYIFVPAATLLFVAGASFAYFVLLPTAVQFLSTILEETVDTQWQIREVVGFVGSFVFWLGVAFQLPLIMYFVSRGGFVTAQTLREQWRYAVVGVAILAAFITPSIDPVTMLLTMIPLLFLYGVSIMLARLGQRQFEGRAGADDT